MDPQRDSGQAGESGDVPVEIDPHGTDPHSPGAKLDAGKTAFVKYVIAYFPRALAAVAEVSAFGHQKYTYNGWSTVPEGVDRYTEAMARHLFAEMLGEEYDKDSGLRHAAQTTWNALARLELKLRNS